MVISLICMELPSMPCLIFVDPGESVKCQIKIHIDLTLFRKLINPY